MKVGAKEILKQTGKGLANIGLGGLIGTGAGVVKNVINKRPLDEGLVDEATRGAVTSYYIPFFNSISEKLATQIIPRVAKEIASRTSGPISQVAGKIARFAPKLADEALTQAERSMWSTIRNPRAWGSTKWKVVKDILWKEVGRSIVETASEGPGYGIIDYVKYDAPLRQALTSNIVSSLLMNPTFRIGMSGMAQPTEQFTQAVNVAVVKGLNKFATHLDNYFSNPKMRQGFIDFSYKFGEPDTENMTDPELRRLGLVQKIQEADDAGRIAEKKALIQELEGLDKEVQVEAPKPMAEQPQPATKPTNLLGEEVPQGQVRVKPQQESMLETTGAGKASPEEIARTQERLLAEKRAGGQTTEGTPLGKELENAQLKEQMGEGLLPEVPKTPEMQKADILSTHALDLENVIREKLGEEKLTKLLDVIESKKMSVTERVNAMREYAAKNKIEIPAMAETEARMVVEDIVTKPQSEWSNKEIKAIAEYMGMNENAVKNFDERTIRTLFRTKINPEQSVPDQAVSDQLEGAMRDAARANDTAQFELLRQARENVIKSAKSAGLDIKVTDADQIKAEMEAEAKQVATEMRKAEVTESMGQLSQLAQYAKVIRDAVGTWQMWRNRGKYEDLASLELRFPGLDEAVDALRELIGREPGIEDLARLKFPRNAVRPYQKRIRVKTTITEGPNTTDDIKKVGEILAEKKVAESEAQQEAGRKEGKFIQKNPEQNPLTSPTVQAQEGTPKLPQPAPQKRLYPGALPEGTPPGSVPPPPKTAGARSGKEANDALVAMLERSVVDKKIKLKKARSLGTRYQQFMEGLINKYYKFGDIAKEYKKKTGKDLPVPSDPQKMAELFAGVPGKISNFIQKEYIEPVLNVAKESGLENELSRYLMFRRFIQNIQYVAMKAEALQASGDYGLVKEGNEMMRRAVTGEINPNKITMGEADRGLKFLKEEMGDERWAQLEGIANRVYQFNEGILDAAANEYKVIPQDVYWQLKQRVKGYVPEFVEKYFKETDLGRMGTGSFDQEFQKYLYRFAGTMEDIEDPLATSMKKAIYLMRYGEEQKVYSALVDSLMATGKAVPLRPGIKPVGAVTRTAEIDVRTMGRLEQAMKSLGIKFKTKIGLGRGVLGMHKGNPMTGESQIFRKFGSSPLTLVHEIGHAIDMRFGLSDIFINKPQQTAKAIRILMDIMEGKAKGPNWTQGPQGLPLPGKNKEQLKAALALFKTVQQELRTLADARGLGGSGYPRKKSEKMANLFASAIMNPEETKRMAPNAYKIFLKFMDTHKELDGILGLRAPSLQQGEERWTTPVFMKTRPKTPAAQFGDESIEAPPGMKVLAVNRDGKFKYYAIPEEMYQTASYLSNAANYINPIFKFLLSDPKKILRSGATTWSLSFALPNFIRDQKRLMTMSKYGFTDPEMIINYPFSLVRGFWSAFRNTLGQEDPLYQSFMNSKAGSSTFQKVMTPEGFLKAFETPSGAERVKEKFRVLNILEKINNVFEEATKLTSFRQGIIKESPEAFAQRGWIKRGLDTKKINPDAIDSIAYEVRNYGGSPDFAKMGINGKELNLLFMFFNARLQGVASDLKRWKEDPAGVMFRQITMAVMPAVGLYVWNHLRAPDARDEAPDYIKDNYFQVYTGRYKYNPDNGKLDYEYFSLPKNDWDRILGNTTEYFMDYARKKDPEAFKQMALNVFGALSPFTFTPKAGVPTAQTMVSGAISSLNPALGLPIELISNYDFFRQQAIVSDSLKKQMPPAQYYSYTTELAKQLANFFPSTKMAPAMIDHIASRAGGSMMTDLFRVVSVPLGGKFEPRYAPILKRFYGWAGGQTDKDLSTQMYTKIRELGQVHATWKQKIKEGRMDEAEYISNQVPQVAVYTKLQQYANDISELRNMGEAVRNNPNYSDAEKQSYTQSLDKNMMDMIEQMNQMVENPSGAKLLYKGDTVQAAESAGGRRALFPEAEAATTGRIGSEIPFKPLNLGGAETTTGGETLKAPRIGLKIPSLQDAREKMETDKEAISAPELYEPSDEKMFNDQFATMSDTIADMESRIKSLRIDRDHSYDVRREYMQLYDEKIQKLRQMRYDYSQMFPEYWKAYLETEEGIAWLKKELKAKYAASGEKLPSWVNNLGKEGGGTKKKGISVTQPKVTIKKVSVKKFSGPKIKIRSTTIKAPKYTLTKVKGASSAPKMPKMKTYKVRMTKKY